MNRLQILYLLPLLIGTTQATQESFGNGTNPPTKNTDQETNRNVIAPNHQPKEETIQSQKSTPQPGQQPSTLNNITNSTTQETNRNVTGTSDNPPQGSSEEDATDTPDESQQQNVTKTPTIKTETQETESIFKRLVLTACCVATFGLVFFMDKHMKKEKAKKSKATTKKTTKKK